MRPSRESNPSHYEAAKCYLSASSKEVFLYCAFIIAYFVEFVNRFLNFFKKFLGFSKRVGEPKNHSFDDFIISNKNHFVNSFMYQKRDDLGARANQGRALVLFVIRL